MIDKNILFTGINVKEDLVKDFLSQTYDISDTHDRKFIETHKVSEYQIKTDDGWTDIYAIGKTIKYDIWHLKTKSFELKCADKHLVFDEDLETIYVDELNVGDKIQTKNGLESITFIQKYDIMCALNTNRWRK